MMRCPCCGETPRPAKDEDARPGDLWCEPCQWLLLRELVADNMEPARCPTHNSGVEPDLGG